MHGKGELLQMLWRERLHAEPTCLERSSPDVQAKLETVWQPGRLFRDLMATLPAGILRLWQESARGHVVFTHRASEYVEGSQEWQGRPFYGVCYLHVADLLEGGERAFLVFARFLDHLLGSAATKDGRYFSDGAGVTPTLAKAAQRFARDERLQYGHEELGTSSPASYFCRCLWLYVNDAQRLNVLDPNIHKLFARTLFQPHIWKKR